MIPRSLSWLVTLAALCVVALAADGGGAVELAWAGKPMQAVVIAAKASTRVQQAAKTLAAHLSRITGGEFQVQPGDGQTELALGLVTDFPALNVADRFHPEDPTKLEDYLLRTHTRGALLVGATDLAVEHAIWDFLHTLGYRQFFPGKHWEVVPSRRDLSVTLDRFEHPSYYSRRIWYGFGAWDYAEQPYRDWCTKNRAVAGIELHTGHAYDGIIKRNKAAFDTHPEYYGLFNGQRRSTKICIGNPAVRKLVVADAQAQFEKNPELQSVSVDPSDGGGWCECEDCKKLGSISDRALTLANEVAAGLTGKNADKLVGMYAYSQHSPPPSLKAHPRVVVSTATAFITGGFSVDQLLAGWGKQTSMLGIREYYSVNTWDRDLPGAARGGRVDYLKRSIPHFHEQGARFLSAESSDNWGPNGLGYYVASRILWDVREANRTDALVADFLEQSFGPARAPMTKFYELLTAEKRPPLCDDLLGRMFQLLSEARKLTTDPAIHARLDDLTLYTRYVELWLDYSTASGTARQSAFEQLIRHTYRMRGTMMVHAKALYRDLDNRDKSVNIPSEARWNVPEVKNPWKKSDPFPREELDDLARRGIANHQLLAFAPIGFSATLVPAAALQLTAPKPGNFGGMSRGTRTYHTWVAKAPATLKFTAAAGLIYNSRGAAKLDLFPEAEPEGKAVAHAEVAPDKAEHAVEFTTTFTGLHRLVVNDSAAGTAVNLPEGMPVVVQSSFDEPAAFHGRWTLAFYVPPGTKIVGGFASGPGTLVDGEGKKVHEFDAKPGYFSIPVAKDQDGKLWQFQNTAGSRLLMTVPPYLARSGSELLLPQEVLKAQIK
ncbi:MAG: DUF4838 domain-containing protein [Proteobacteria bacterium]|nr:DUF4838 domain-containing protein [Pseudomonadota bacterium]